MFVVLLRYAGKPGQARKFAETMEEKGIADAIRKEPGNLGYEYFIPLDDPDSILLMDQWESQEALDAHHRSPMMAEIAKLRDAFDLHMSAMRLQPEALPDQDSSFLRK